ncbi:HD family phosphohydrolase [Thalassobacillus pellis]|uniref:HD family phosphohydrolase n=1 Tax=Thalassobacillus pellis TaxID=748008 RepID=UPI001EF949F5|nr:HDIG domain-containing metalloprotein [Thalassobacillus pellis]MBM7554729.1 putative nucleotidyltransferase with HDIG domain [Thalassobacillus pellis]
MNKALWKKWMQSLNRQQGRGRLLFPALLIGSFFFIFMLSNVYTETYDIKKFSISEATIRSPITIENVKETERLKREASQAVQDYYSNSVKITEERVGYVDEVFEAIDTFEQKKTDDHATVMTAEEKVHKLHQLLSQEIIMEMQEKSLKAIVEAEHWEQRLAHQLLKTSLYDRFNQGIKAEEVKEAEQQLKSSLRYASLDGNLKKAVIDLGQAAIVTNSFFDNVKTARAQEQAALNVEPVTIRAGEIIVSEGGMITSDVYEKLKLVGLLDKERNLYPLFGLGILTLLLSFLILYELLRLARLKVLKVQHVVIVVTVSISMTALMKLVSIFSNDVNNYFYLVPLACGVMLLKMLVAERIAIMMACIFSLLACFIFNGEIPGTLHAEAGIYYGMSQLAAIILLHNLKDRLAILKAGAGLAVVNILVVLLFLFLSFEKYSWTGILLQSGFAAISAFLASVLTLGLLPFFETGFGVLTDTKLLTLSNPNHPLLRKILTEAPGTYHHSVMVANLSESACEAIGANGLLARVAAYYHDLGKTVRPHFFIENQMGMKNPHDFLSPEDSAEIIINHPYDGADLLKKKKMPQEIIDIAEQHHGTTLLKYFYYKARDEEGEVLEELYRYPGPKPQTKEAAILCICDSVEAAVRSLNEPTNAKIKDIITKITEDRLSDGQLDECPLTLLELNKIQQAIYETLQGIFHSRIQYPTKTKKLVKEAK